MDGSEAGLNRPSIYRVIIQGRLHEKWSVWFNGMLVNSIMTAESSNDTLLIIAVPDQAALRGVINKIWDLNLNLISINLIPAYAHGDSIDEII